MRALIACEFSGVVRDEFAALGWDAWSCDLLPSERPGKHFQCDVRDVINQGWDLLLAFPPCTYLCSSGMHWTTRGLRDPKLTEDALGFVRLLLDAPVQRIALENPVGAISTRIRKPDQIIQPYHFGEDASKATCLWLKGLPQLEPTQYHPPRLVCSKCQSTSHYEASAKTGCAACGAEPGLLKPRWSNQTGSGQNRLGPSEKRAADRAKTYPGVARAMARQWTDYLAALPT